MVITGCSKKPEISPEEISEPQIEQTAELEQPIEIEKKTIAPVEVTETVTQVNDSEINDNVEISEIEEVQVVEVPVDNSVLETLPKATDESEEEISSPQVAINPQFDFDQIFPDSVWTDYMIKPGDYLSLIAYKEYRNANEWRRIYEWNREKIGDNPNLIYPYYELDLKKPREEVVEWKYDHTIHLVESGETLWTISKKEYGDEYAWIVLFWDNEKVIEETDGVLYPGMEIKVRTELWPKL